MLHAGLPHLRPVRANRMARCTIPIISSKGNPLRSRHTRSRTPRTTIPLPPRRHPSRNRRPCLRPLHLPNLLSRPPLRYQPHPPLASPPRPQHPLSPQHNPHPPPPDPPATLAPRPASLRPLPALPLQPLQIPPISLLPHSRDHAPGRHCPHKTIPAVGPSGRQADR